MTKKSALSKESWAGLISSLIEAYNMAIYNFTAPFVARLLFHDKSAWTAIFFSYSLVFVGSCILYPAGAFYYGLLGDKKGRQRTCTYSALGLAAATGMIGLIPFNFLGDLAWVCLLFFISAQHFFSGGEYHGSIVFSLEHAKEHRNGLMSSLSCLFAVFGLIIANYFATLSFLMKNETLVRSCFLFGSIGGIVSYFLKNHCRETPDFASLSQESLKTVHLRSFIQAEWRKTIAVALVFSFFIVTYSFIFIFLPLIFVDQAQSFSTLQALMVYGLFLVLSGALADHIGMENVMITGVCLFAASLLPLCYFCADLLVLQVVLTVCICFVIGPIHSWMLHQFKPQERCRGIFVSSALATSLFGGSTVPICLLIFEKSNSLYRNELKIWFLAALASLTLNPAASHVCLHTRCFAAGFAWSNFRAPPLPKLQLLNSFRYNALLYLSTSPCSSCS